MSSLPSWTSSVLDLGVFAVLALLAMAFSLLVVEHRSLVYSAFFLALLGLVNASFIATLGFTVIALFHVAVYVGASVLFMIFSVTMFRGGPVVERRTMVLALAVIPMFSLALSAVFLTFQGTPVPGVEVSYMALSKLIVEKYWLPLLIFVVAMATTMMQAIVLTRKEVGRR